MEQISFLLSTWNYAFIKNQFWGCCHVLSASNMSHEQKKVVKQYWINDSTLVITCPHWKTALLKSQLGKLWPSLIFNGGKKILGQTLRIKGKRLETCCLRRWDIKSPRPAQQKQDLACHIPGLDLIFKSHKDQEFMWFSSSLATRLGRGSCV